MDFDIAGISEQGEEEKESAEHILPFGHPGDGLHMERVQCKERGDKRAPPGGARQALEQQEQQGGIGGMEQQTDQVVPPCVKAEQLHVQQMRDPRHWMPVLEAGVAGLKGPDQVSPRQALLHVRVGGHVAVVIIIDEIVPGHRPKSRQGHGAQQRANQQRAAAILREVHYHPPTFAKPRPHFNPKTREWRSLLKGNSAQRVDKAVGHNKIANYGKSPRPCESRPS